MQVNWFLARDFLSTIVVIR